MHLHKQAERVAVTGLGLVTPLGLGVEQNWQGLMAGKNGIAPISLFDPGDLPCRFAGEVLNFDGADYLDKKMARQYDRYIHFAVAAGDLALEDAGLSNDTLPKEGTAILVGSGMGGVKTFFDNSVTLHERGHKRITPFFIPATIANMASGLMAIRYGTRGVNFSIVSACATGAHSVGEGCRMLQNGDADLVLAGGAEAAVIPLCIAGFAATKALSERNDAPAKASRPFDVDRDGFVLGEGAGVLVLERESFARARNARIYAYLKGVGHSSDAYHATAPSPEGIGAALSMQRALADAGLQASDLGYINAHATSTQLGDKAEVSAIRKLLGPARDRVPISSTKSMTGHLLGAAGAVEAAYTVLALYHGQLPPTINLDRIDPECEMDHIPNRPRQAKIDFALSNAFGFGGTNSSLVFGRE